MGNAKKHKVSKLDDAIYQYLLDNPDFDIRSDGTVWTRISINGNGRIPDGSWRHVNSVGEDGYIRIHVKTAEFDKTKRQPSLVILAHRAVFAKYVGKLDSSMVVNHINGQKNDNRPENLELISVKANLHHAIDVLKHNPMQNARLNFEIADEIRELRKQGWTYKQLVDKFKISKGHVSEIVNNKIWVNRKYESYTQKVQS